MNLSQEKVTTSLQSQYKVVSAKSRDTHNFPLTLTLYRRDYSLNKQMSKSERTVRHAHIRSTLEEWYFPLPLEKIMSIVCRPYKKNVMCTKNQKEK